MQKNIPITTIKNAACSTHYVRGFGARIMNKKLSKLISTRRFKSKCKRK